MNLRLKRSDIPDHLLSFFRPVGHKPKDLINVPFMVAEALREDGWYLRSDICWAKPNPMPESATDRPTRSHEYVFLLSKSARYYYDAAAIAEEAAWERWGDQTIVKEQPGTASWIKPKTKQELVGKSTYAGFNGRWAADPDKPRTRNKRSVWTIATQPFSQAHFAVMPTALVEPCILAGSSERGQCPACGAPWRRVVERPLSGQHDGIETPRYEGTGLNRYTGAQSPGVKRFPNSASLLAQPTVQRGWQPACTCDAGDPVPQTILDPFGGAMTVGVVALRYGRNFVGVELNPDYAEMGRKRIESDAPLFNAATVETGQREDAVQLPLGMTGGGR